MRRTEAILMPSPVRRHVLGACFGFGIAMGLCIPGALPALAQQAASTPQSQPVLVFAAASLQTALKTIGTQWQKDTGKTVIFSYAASSALARQIEQGAPADLFASADLDWMDWAEQRNLMKAETRRRLLGNALVLIEPADQPATPLRIAPGFPLAAALGNARLVTGNPASVPVGKYAKQALAALGIWDQISPRLAGTENVRAALSLVARGEARYGIVYMTDAKSEPKVRVVDRFPASSHAAIVYPFAVAAGSKNPDAQTFLNFLSSPAARRIFEAEGFTLLN